MATDRECLDYARQCIRLAELTRDSELRDHLLALARAWMATVAVHERMVQTSKSGPA